MNFFRKYKYIIIWMNSLTFRPRLKKKSMIQISFRIQQVSSIRLAQSGIRVKNYNWSTIHYVFKICESARSIYGINPQSVRFIKPNPSIRKPIHSPPNRTSKLQLDGLRGHLTKQPEYSKYLSVTPVLTVSWFFYTKPEKMLLERLVHLYSVTCNLFPIRIFLSLFYPQLVISISPYPHFHPPSTFPPTPSPPSPPRDQWENYCLGSGNRREFHIQDGGIFQQSCLCSLEIFRPRKQVLFSTSTFW